MLPPDDEDAQVVALPGASSEEMRFARLEDEIRELKAANRILLRLVEYLTEGMRGPRR